MGFQTKIFLWMLGTLAAILIPTLTLVKTKLRQKAEERAEMEFANQVQLFVAERVQRLQGVSETAAELARSEVVKRSLSGKLDEADKRAFATEAISKRPAAKRQGKGDRSNRAEAGGGLPKLPKLPQNFPGQNLPIPKNPTQKTPGQLLSLLPVLCTIDMQGRIEELTPTRPGRSTARKTMALRHDGALRELPDVSEVQQQEVFYLIPPDNSKGGRLREVVATPVEQDGKMIGVFVMGIDAETQLDHLASRLERSAGESASTTGFFAEGQVVQLKGLREIDPADLSALVAGEIDGEKGMSVVTLDGEPYRLAWQEMNPGSILPSAYQIAFFPMAAMLAEIRSLQTKLLMVGGAALLLAAIASFFISRGLARPVLVLDEATRRVGEGDFSARVDIASKDEIGRLGQSFNEMAEGLALKERYREVLSKVSDEAVAQSLIEGQLELGGETRYLTVLFCDIRGFTSLTETMDPHEVISMLNEHMTAMTELVYAHRGVVDKFVGDEIMAVFGAPKEYGDDPSNAVRCALAMVAKRWELNAMGGHKFDIGIGVASGEMVAGCMGSVDRLNYTVVGERVNLAARLCSKAGPGEVMAAVSEDIAEGERVRVEVKGFSEPVEAIRVSAIRSSEPAV